MAETWFIFADNKNKWPGMQTYNDVHRQFAELFKSENLKPYAYLVSKKLSEGHICVNMGEIENEDLPEAYSRFNLDKHDLIKETFVAAANEQI